MHRKFNDTDILNLDRMYYDYGWHRGGWFFLRRDKEPFITKDYEDKPHKMYTSLELDSDTLELIIGGKENGTPYYFTDLEAPNNPRFIKTVLNKNSMVFDMFPHLRPYMIGRWKEGHQIFTKSHPVFSKVLEEYLSDILKFNGMLPWKEYDKQRKSANRKRKYERTHIL